MTFKYDRRNCILFIDDTENRVACVCHVLKLSNKKCVGSLITCAAETMQLWHHSENLCHSLGWEGCHGAFCSSWGFCVFLFPPSILVHLPPCVCLCLLQQRYAVKFVTTFSSVFATVFFLRLCNSSCLCFSSSTFRFSSVYLLCSQCLRPTRKFSPWTPVHAAQPTCPPQLLLTTVY